MSSANKKKTSRSTGSTSTRRKAASAKNKSARSKQASKAGAAADNDISFIGAEVIMLLVLAFSILLLLSNFGLCGKVGELISNVSFGIFGVLSYVLPFGIFLGCGLYVSNRGNLRMTIKLFAGILLFIFLCIMAQLVTKAYLQSTLSAGKPMDFYIYSSQNKTAGGIIGGTLCSMLYSAFGAVGTYVIDITLIIISLVVITEKSFFKGLKRGGDKVYKTAKAGSEKRHEKAVQRQARAEERRALKRVSGVSINTDIKGKKEPKSEDLHEITMDFPPTPDNAVMNQSADKVLDVFPINMDTFDKEAAAEAIDEPAFEPVIENINQNIDTGGNIPIILGNSDASVQDYNMKSDAEDFNKISSASSEMTELEYEAVEIIKEAPKKSDKKQDFDDSKKKQSKQSVNEQIHNEITANNQASPAPNIIKEEYKFPPIDLLKKGKNSMSKDIDKHLRETASKLQQTLQNFGVKVTVTNISCGPTVTRYELQPDQGVKVSKIVGLSDDIKLNLAAADIRIEAPIPGKAAVGIEVPNKENSVVMFRDLLESEDFKKHTSNIAFAAGKDISGHAVVADIAKMPHLLIAGATGSGKSVCINTLIMSILYKANPEDVKLIMIDPKVVELSVYNGIPHLMIPVVTDPKKAAGALNWAVAEMTDRYKKFADLNVRDLKGYNEKIKSIEDIEDDDKPKKLPQIVIIVDELADLMMVAPGEVEDSICRLAQLARAAGLHLIIATQRPSVNVITGLIKANMPSRIAFAVSSGVDSRTIIDMNGAEKLLGKGDMLFYPQGYQKPARVQGAFISDSEVSAVVEFLSQQHGAVEYNKEVEASISSAQQNTADAGGANDRDAYFVEAGKFIIEKDKASIGMLQRVFKIGFNRAARIMDQLCDAGVVGEEEGTKPRKVLMSMEEFEQFIDECL